MSPPLERESPAFAVTPMRIAFLAVVILLVLGTAYWALVRTTYQAILSNVEPQDAADIVKVLDEQKIPYQLADEGRTILVDSVVADKARIELVGSELPMRGQVGFELFNKSDMGLTEFDQKINYQRALQGELSRTILMLDGIKSVRVHLGLPEQSAFRDDQSRPKASVTVILKPGSSLTEGRVRGIQHLVAGAIRDMTPDAVAVLDGTGRIVSDDTSPPPAAITDSDRELDQFRDKLTQAIRAASPGLRFELNVSLKSSVIASDQEASADATGSETAATPATPGDENAGPAHIVRVTTDQALDAAHIALLTQAIKSNGYDKARGDTLDFLVAPIPDMTPIAAISAGVDHVVSRGAPAPAPKSNSHWLAYWPWIIAASLILLAAAFWSDRQRSRRLQSDDLASFTEQLRMRLEASDSLA